MALFTYTTYRYVGVGTPKPERTRIQFKFVIRGCFCLENLQMIGDAMMDDRRVQFNYQVQTVVYVRVVITYNGVCHLARR